MLALFTVIFLSAISIEATSLTRRDPPEKSKGKGEGRTKAKGLYYPKKSCRDGQLQNWEGYKDSSLAKDPKFNGKGKKVDFKFSAVKKQETFYIVQEGDDLLKVAEEFASNFNTSKGVDDIAVLNSLPDPWNDVIFIGQPLRLPDYFTIPEKCDDRFQIFGYASKKAYYMVQSDDFLEQILVFLAPHRLKETPPKIDDLKMLNNIDDENSLFGGQLLVLPEDFARLNNGKNFVELTSCRK
jgi:hypothetical protein